MSLDKQRIKKVKKNLCLPINTKFCGFVIYIPKNNEFIASINENSFSKVIAYSKAPIFSLKFKSYKKSIKTAKSCDKYETVIACLFDLGEEYCVGFEDKYL